MSIDHVIDRQAFPWNCARGSGYLSARCELAGHGNDSTGRFFRIRDIEENPRPPLIELPAHGVGISARDDRQAKTRRLHNCDRLSAGPMKYRDAFQRLVRADL